MAGRVGASVGDQESTYLLERAPTHHAEGVWRVVGMSAGCHDGHKAPQVQDHKLRSSGSN